MKGLLLLIAIFIWPVYTQREKGQELCFTTDDMLGACVTLSNCPSIIAITEGSNNSSTTREFMTKTRESCDSRTFLGDPIVCCKEAYRGSRRGKGRKKGLNKHSKVNITESTSETTPMPSLIQRISDDEDPCRTPDTAEGTCRGARKGYMSISANVQMRNLAKIEGFYFLLGVGTGINLSYDGVCFDSSFLSNLVQCNSLMEQLRVRQNDPTFVQFLRESNLACSVPPPTVCCPIERNLPELARRLPTKEEGCGQFSSSQDKIVGGTEADVGSYPWIALLGYEDVFGGISFRCGGVLITVRHVLTAAHCILRDLKFARLGEHDLQSDSETFHTDIGISKVEAHPQYSRNDGHSDIGILHLEKYAPFTKLIRPICLPQRSASYVGSRAFVAGWGRTMEGGPTSDVLQEIRIPIHQNSVCTTSYTRLRRISSAKQFDEAVICAGVLEGGVDTCQGDSGGPLMVPETYNGKPIFTAVGIVSYSLGCARPNTPSVYASIPYFMDWIESKVADTS